MLAEKLAQKPLAAQKLWVNEVAPLMQRCLDLESSGVVLEGGPSSFFRESLQSSADPLCESLMANISGAAPGFKGFGALFGALTRCPSPWYRVRDIKPNHVTWTPAPAPEPPSKEGQRADEQGATTDEASPPSTPADAESTEGSTPTFLAFLLLVDHDYFSSQLKALAQAVAPAFPQVSFVSGDGAKFNEFTHQYHVRSFPKLLFFRDGILQAVYPRRKKRTPAAMAAFLTNMTGGMLPQAFVPPEVVALPVSLLGPGYRLPDQDPVAAKRAAEVRSSSSAGSTTSSSSSSSSNSSSNNNVVVVVL